MVKYASMKNDTGTHKGIPRNKWNNLKVTEKQKDFLKHSLEKMMSNPNTDEKTKKLIKDIMRFGLK